MKKFFVDILEMLGIHTPTPEFVPEAPPKKTVASVVDAFNTVISDLDEVATTAAKECVETQEKIELLTKQVGELQNEQDKASTIAKNLRKIISA